MPNFWTSPTFEPKRAFRFLVEFAPEGEDSLQFLAKSVSRPSYTVSSNPHKFFNHTFHYPGRVEWNTVNLTLVDAVSPNASAIFMRYLTNIGYADPTQPAPNAADINNVSNQPIVLSTITKHTATSALGIVLIKEVGTSSDPSNTLAQNRATTVKAEWVLNNAFITEVNFGEHSYDSEDLIDVQLTLQYDWANYIVK